MEVCQVLIKSSLFVRFLRKVYTQKMRKENEKTIFFILGFLFLVNLFAWIIFFDLKSHKFLKVNFFDVGQGDAIFVETPQGHQILIDGGPSSKIIEKLAREIPFWDRSIDLIILTHPERDHITGLLEVLKRYRVENILWTGIVRNIPEYKEWLNLLEKEKANVKIARAGQKISCKNCQWEIEVFYPFENLEGIEFEDSNDTSIISKLIFGSSSFLFTGDIYKDVEESLSLTNFDLNSKILKVAHHGSKTSSSEKFLEKVSPEIAVISVGENKYGHPHRETLEALGKYGIKVLRTDLNGDIKITSNGSAYQIE
jgi:competence protein ComEC